MKTYQKPVLVALSLNANDRLCGECNDNGASILLYRDPTGDVAHYFDLLAGDRDGTLTKGEFERLFSSTNDSCSFEAVGYCKFSSTGLTVAWS